MPVNQQLATAKTVETSSCHGSTVCGGAEGFIYQPLRRPQKFAGFIHKLLTHSKALARRAA